MSASGTALPGTALPGAALPAEPRRSQAGRHRVLGWVIVTVPFLVLAERGWSRRHMSDDGSIDVRVPKQPLAGHSPAFNGAQRGVRALDRSLPVLH